MIEVGMISVFLIKICIAIEGCFVGSIAYVNWKKPDSDSNFFIHCCHSVFYLHPPCSISKGAFLSLRNTSFLITVSNHISWFKSPLRFWSPAVACGSLFGSLSFCLAESWFVCTFLHVIYLLTLLFLWSAFFFFSLNLPCLVNWGDPFVYNVALWYSLSFYFFLFHFYPLEEKLSFSNKMKGLKWI